MPGGAHCCWCLLIVLPTIHSPHRKLLVYMMPSIDGRFFLDTTLFMLLHLNRTMSSPDIVTLFCLIVHTWTDTGTDWKKISKLSE